MQVLPELMRAGGSPGGAGPKVLVGIKGNQIVSGEDELPDGYPHWIIKFSSKADARDAGPVEYAIRFPACHRLGLPFQQVEAWDRSPMTKQSPPSDGHQPSYERRCRLPEKRSAPEILVMGVEASFTSRFERVYQ